MPTYYATLTTKGQVTVPVEIRRSLGLKPNEKIAFTIEDGRVQIEPLEFDLESVIGSVPVWPDASPDFEREIEIATQEAAEKTWREMRGERL
jgi:AbrB family looped-hinge helix DNA binding protein